MPIFLAGFLAGIMFFVASTVVLDVKPPMFSHVTFTASDFATLFAALAGAIVGGGISWLLARQTASEQRRRDTDTSNAHDKATLLQLILKTMQISNGIYTIHRNIESSIEEYEEKGLMPTQIWQMVRPVAGRTDVPKFEASDFVPFAISGRADLIDRVIRLSNRYEAIETGFREYSERRLSFQDFAAPYTILGALGSEHTTKFPTELAAQAQMKGYELEQLIRQIRDFADKDVNEGKELCLEIDKFSKKFLEGKGGFVSIALDTEQSSPSK